MARPQLEDGRTEIANELIEAIIRTHFSPTEHSILWAIIRKTYGWHKKIDRISFTQLEELTGINRRHIAPALQGLVKRKIIIRQGEKQSLEYGIQKDFDLWQPLPKPVMVTVTDLSNETITNIGNEPLPIQVTVKEDKPLPILVQPLPISDKTVTDFSTKPLPISVHTKAITKDNTKETIQKQCARAREAFPGKKLDKEIYNLPDYVDGNTWDEYLKMRKKKRAAPTDRAIELIVKDLETFHEQHYDVNKLLELSIKNSWVGVFPRKEFFNGRTGTDKTNPRELPKQYTRPEDL